MILQQSNLVNRKEFLLYFYGSTGLKVLNTLFCSTQMVEQIQQHKYRFLGNLSFNKRYRKGHTNRYKGNKRSSIGELAIWLIWLFIEITLTINPMV